MPTHKSSINMAFSMEDSVNLQNVVLDIYNSKWLELFTKKNYWLILYSTLTGWWETWVILYAFLTWNCVNDTSSRPSTVQVCPLTTDLSNNVITVMSNKHHGVSNHQQLNCLFNSLFRLTAKEISKLWITGPLWGESIGYQWIPLTKGQ